MTRVSKQLATEVATELERRRRRRRLLTALFFAALIAAAVLLVRCGAGWGLGGGGGDGAGTGSAAGSGSTVDAGPRRCSIRVAANGIFVDGTQRTRDEAVEACKATEGAVVTVTGDARQGDWDELRAALEAVRVKIYVRGPISD